MDKCKHFKNLNFTPGAKYIFSATPVPESLRHIGMMALRSNIPNPMSGDWELATCPKCGRECWYQTENAKLLKELWPNTLFLCTECALSEGIGNE